MEPLAPDPEIIKRVAEALTSGKKAVLVLGTPAVVPELHELLQGISETTGALLMGSPAISRLPRGRGRLALPFVPYSVDEAVRTLKPYEVVVLVNCPPPTGFFLYPGRPSLMHRPDASVLTLTSKNQNASVALHLLAQELGADPTTVLKPKVHDVGKTSGVIEPNGFAAVVAKRLPADAIVVNEALTLGSGFGAVMPHAEPCDWLTVTGGAIGGGIPLATGAAIGAKALGRGDRRVVNVQADGSAAYTVQALWTQARENLPVTTLLLNNKSYAILLGEYEKVGATPGKTALDVMSLDRPALNWKAIAQGFGVAAVTVATLEDLDAAFSSALVYSGPMLIDVHFA